MRLGARIFICNMLIFTGCFYCAINWVVNHMYTRYFEGVEDVMVDQASILAGIAGYQMESGQDNLGMLYRVFDKIYDSPISARIYDLVKTDVDMQVYITDMNGTVIFDSLNRANIGEDYSSWRDVAYTLDGRYGARITYIEPGDETSAVLFVASPIKTEGKMAGVLTVGKPTVNISKFFTGAKAQIYWVGILALIAGLIFNLLASMWITRPINRLTRYADDIVAGKRVEFPDLGRGEIGDMGAAFKNMKEALEGKKYVEKYVQTLTHEIKSPLSAIRGAAELLEEKMAPEQRARFLANIRNESNRIKEIVERLLELSALENRKILPKIEKIPLHPLVTSILESKQPMISRKHLETVVRIQDDLMVAGDPFLLNQAISNLVQNAIDFSPALGRIVLTGKSCGKKFRFTVDDDGPGIPPYAKDKIFDRFFSLRRPDNDKKSTGLGLNFVKEVATLHDGEVKLANLNEKGVRATLII